MRVCFQIKKNDRDFGPSARVHLKLGLLEGVFRFYHKVELKTEEDLLCAFISAL